ncbi:MAG: glycosyltransferase family 39 protein, partial [Oscillospiraceae bacterium]|nr:glycosyltransferase family 39 protein [Oscillospiraceae bacterium]
MKEKALSRKTECILVCLLLVLGIFLRFYAIGSLPYGLNQDEASSGYEAWALLTSGIDRNGDAFPVLFTSWGSGQNVLMSYLAIPFVALFGLSEMSIRIPNALFGCISLVVFWLLARKTRGERFALTALLLLGVNPWHIMMSRWALESNLLPAFLLMGIYFTVLAKDKQWFLLPASVSYAIGIYAYGTAFFVLPILLVGSIIWL